MKTKLVALIANAVTVCTQKGLLPDVELSHIEIEVPANPEHGDYASNVAMILASQAKQNPRNIAKIIQENLTDPDGIIEKTQIAGPGFLNFRMKDDLWRKTLQNILREKEKYGSLNIGQGKKVQVEFVSANPTGPLHIGHARGAVVGDVLANLLSATG
jgi:arginyl-tRNA synthetase